VTAPFPPADLHHRTPALLLLPTGTSVHRFYTSAFDPIYFDRSTLGRFNAPDGSYGVLYAAEKIAGAFAETFLRRPGRSIIDADFLRRKAYVRIELQSDLAMIMLAGPGLAILGATAQVPHSGLPYDVPQAWSKALFQHPVQADGIAYRARHDDDQLCYAFFDRSMAALQEMERKSDLDEDWFWEVATRYRGGLAPG
jgi:hypothetical protein